MQILIQWVGTDPAFLTCHWFIHALHRKDFEHLRPDARRVPTLAYPLESPTELLKRQVPGPPSDLVSYKSWRWSLGTYLLSTVVGIKLAHRQGACEVHFLRQSSLSLTAVVTLTGMAQKPAWSAACPPSPVQELAPCPDSKHLGDKLVRVTLSEKPGWYCHCGPLWLFLEAMY